MADKKSKPGQKTAETAAGKTPETPNSLLCAEFEALLVDALDGTLTAKDAAAFEAHRETCLACAELLEETKRGGQWLNFLKAEPEVPRDLVTRILSQTSGASVNLARPGLPGGMMPQVAIAGMPAATTAQPWQTPGWLPGLERHAMQSRWMMTVAMAFFSIAFTLNLTGVRLTGLKLSDLKPSALASSVTRGFYAADAHVMRYYDNLRFVYELESRVRQMKRDVVPATSTPDKTPDKTGQQPKKPGDGSAQKSLPGQPEPTAAPVAERTGEPVMASFHQNHLQSTKDSTCTRLVSTPKASTIRKDRAERSLA